MNRSHNGAVQTFLRGLRLGVLLGRGKQLTRADIMQLTGCSRASAGRYMAAAERGISARWERGSGGGHMGCGTRGLVYLPEGPLRLRHNVKVER